MQKSLAGVEGTFLSRVTAVLMVTEVSDAMALV